MEHAAALALGPEVGVVAAADSLVELAAVAAVGQPELALALGPVAPAAAVMPAAVAAVAVAGYRLPVAVAALAQGLAVGPSRAFPLSLCQI